MKSPSIRAVVAAVGGGMLVVSGLLTLLWLLVDGGSPQAAVQMELVRVALTIVLGGGGLFGLWLAWRRQRSTEIALQQKERDQADVTRAYQLQRETFETTRQHQERVAEATDHDAEARRITDLYIKAVEQLGSDKAPVRLGGLYALERLAQDHIEQRQTIVNVICAYLRMPYTLPGDDPALVGDHQEHLQEREVRLAAQRILCVHLLPGVDFDNRIETFWEKIDLDLTGATLIDMRLTDCRIRDATFRDATFIGEAVFRRAVFTGNAVFSRATFTDTARFGEVTFDSGARFKDATFASHAWFRGAVFTGDTVFNGATFRGDVLFRAAVFTGPTRFSEVTLPNIRRLNTTTPSPWTSFTGAQFARKAPAEVEQFISPLTNEIAESP